jgi:hypothetical protein
MNILSKFPPQPACLVVESDDNYPNNIRLNDRWRIINCRDGLQWILQRRHGPGRPAGARWAGRSYCRTSAALIGCCRAYSGAIDPAAMAALEALPVWFPSPASGGQGRRLGFPNSICAGALELDAGGFLHG